MRKIIQITASEGTIGENPGNFNGDPSLYALCDDNTLWVLNFGDSHIWERLPDIPQNSPIDEVFDKLPDDLVNEALEEGEPGFED